MASNNVSRDIEFGARVRRVRGEDTLAEAARKVQLHGGKASNVAFQKWERGGEITEPNVRALCAAYGVSPAWLRYGVGTMHSLSAAQKVAIEAIDDLSTSAVQSTLDFIGYQIQTASAPSLAEEQAARYLAMIEGAKAEMTKRQNEK